MDSVLTTNCSSFIDFYWKFWYIGNTHTELQCGLSFGSYTINSKISCCKTNLEELEKGNFILLLMASCVIVYCCVLPIIVC